MWPDEPVERGFTNLDCFSSSQEIERRARDAGGKEHRGSRFPSIQNPWYDGLDPGRSSRTEGREQPRSSVARSIEAEWPSHPLRP
jgi:hypothetical protein